jgi:putative heme iron utilization protein
MFKVFVRRGADRSLDPAQVERFEALAERLSA